MSFVVCEFVLINFFFFFFFFSKKSFRITLLECQTVWIQIRPDKRSGLIWTQTVCKGYQQTTKVATSGERVSGLFLKVTWSCEIEVSHIGKSGRQNASSHIHRLSTWTVRSRLGATDSMSDQILRCLSFIQQFSDTASGSLTLSYFIAK